MIIGEMVGVDIVSVTGVVGEDEMVFTFYYIQDCHEGVSIEDIVGDLSDLVGTLVIAEEVSSNYKSESEFYRFATVKGTVTDRWYGLSNGYYSESVDFKIDPA